MARPITKSIRSPEDRPGVSAAHVFHSTRNTLAILMERAGVARGIAADIVGHDKKTMTGLYISGSAKEHKLAAISTVVYSAPLSTP